MSFITLDKKGILEYQKNRDPYLFIDHATKIYPGKSSEGYKDLKPDEWFFKVHWPNDPNMPGFLQLEALTQMSSLSILTMPNNKGEIMYLVSVNKVTFKKKIVPNSRLNIITKVIKYSNGFGTFEAKGFVNEEIACSGEFNLVLPKELSKFTKNLKK